ncbi:MAG TPA: hypothetical protein P5137_16670 [Candidatus Brocadiia bacterium]|nr:hypothetical protein [Candidatus Brocadiia bacterium]
MVTKHAILELPAQAAEFEDILDDENHKMRHVAFSSAVVDGALKHFVLLVWHDSEESDHLF